MYEVGDEYTENDLERDLKKTQALPFMQLGTPSPYRAPPKTRIAVQVVRASAPSEPAAVVSSAPIARPTHVKSHSVSAMPTNVPQGLKTPSSQTSEWSRPKPPGASNAPIPVPNFSAAISTTSTTSNENHTSAGGAKVSNFSNGAAVPAPTPSNDASKANTTSLQTSSVKIVPSRYMQALQKTELAAKSTKKAGSARLPLSTVEANNNSIQTNTEAEKRRLTMAGPKKVGTTKQTASRASVGPTSRSNAVNNVSNNVPKDNIASAVPADSILSKSSSQSMSSIPLSSTQADLRAALLQRREQKAAAAAAAKQSAKNPISRPSLGPAAPTIASSRPSLGNTSRELSSASRDPSRESLTRQTPNSSKNLAISRTTSDGIESVAASGRVVSSRYMNIKTPAPDSLKRNGESSGENHFSADPKATPSSTPRTLTKSFSTSSLKKLQTTKKATEQSAPNANTLSTRDSATVAQLGSISARVAHATSSNNGIKENADVQTSSTSARTPQSVHMEVQLLQTQLLQWHFINHRLEQARNAKRATSTHMMLSVMKKIEEMKNRTNFLSSQLNARQANVYTSELEEFKMSCIAPMIYSIYSFLEKYSDTASQLEKDAHKMPTHGVSVSNIHQLLASLEEVNGLLEKIESEFNEEFKAWETTSSAVQRLSATIKEESAELLSYAEMLHALSSMSTNEASLIFHKLQLDQQKNPSSSRLFED